MGKVFIHGTTPPSGAEERARQRQACARDPAGMFPAYDTLADAGLDTPGEGLHNRSMRAKRDRYRHPGPGNLGINFVGQYEHMGNDVTG